MASNQGAITTWSGIIVMYDWMGTFSDFERAAKYLMLLLQMTNPSPFYVTNLLGMYRQYPRCRPRTEPFKGIPFFLITVIKKILNLKKQNP